ncbi:MAG TPA: CAP domain-containing protein [Myxococcota bacterium]|nr:CAP domain-containing protein [Myxococcota bacterium]
MPRTPSQAAAFVIGVWIALWLLCPGSASAQARGALVGTSTWPASMPPAAEFTPLEAELHRSVNGVRSQAGLIELRRDPVLDAVAREHSLDMAQRHYFAHETPEGLNPVDRLKRGGASGFSLAGENVGLTSRGDPNREILEGWLASPVHRQNLLAPAFNATGIGIAQAADGTLYYTQVYVTYRR